MLDDLLGWLPPYFERCASASLIHLRIENLTGGTWLLS